MNSDNLINRLVNNPIFHLTGWILGVISVVFTVIFFYISQKERELTYLVNPVKAVIVNSHRSSDLEVYYKKKEIINDVIAVQIGIWNAGKEPIKKEDILSPIILYTSNSNQILQTIIRKRSREIIGVNAIQDTINKNQVLVDWKILEHDDWFILQLTYEGKMDAEILLKGIIEGQSAMYSKVNSTVEPTVMNIIISTVISFIIVSYYNYRRKKKNLKIISFDYLMGFLIILFSILITFISKIMTNKTPFDF